MDITSFFIFKLPITGAYTALLPYSQERYLANHAIMSAVDKLHKLYGTDNETAVWARSIGLEILNELDSIKAALMMFAGARSASVGPADLNFAGNAVNAMATTAKTIGAVSAAIAGSLSSVIDTFAKSNRP